MSSDTRPGFFKQYFYIFKRILAFNKGLLIGYSLITIFTGFLPQLEAFISGRLIDYVVNNIKVQNGVYDSTVIHKLVPSVALAIIIFFSMRAIYDIQSYLSQCFNLYSQNYRDNLQFETLLRLPPHVYEDSKFIALKKIIDYNLWKLGNLIYWPISIFGAVFANLFVIGVFIAYSPWILVTAILSLILPSYARLKFGKRVWGIWDSLSDRKVIYSIYRGPLFKDDPDKFTETKVFGYGQYLLQKFLNINKDFFEGLVKNEKSRLRFMFFSRATEYFFVGVGYLVIFSLVVQGKISIGSLYFLITMYSTLRSSTSYTLDQITSVMTDAPFLNSLYEFLTYAPAYKVQDGEKLLPIEAPSIEFKDVWFKYPGTETWVLKGVSFNINAKSDIAFVGKNGAGKSTLIKLILRVYDATKGEILINGINIKELSISDYYKQIGILAQDFHKFRFSAKENISVGDITKDAFLEDIIESAKKAEADEFINKYANKYDTYLTRELAGGVNPSGGQLQRIAIARVFYRNPKLIILDEPTSAIDSLAEEQIFDNIKKEAHDKTVIIISHRFATVKKAEYIFVLDEGIIKESGTHDQLCSNDGLYSRMFAAQQG